MTLPASVTGGFSLKVALCNKCMNAAVNEFTKAPDEENNYNHIPRLEES